MRRFPPTIIPLVAVAFAACPASTGANFWPAYPVGSVHTLLPSPTTVVYGGYDPVASPVLRVTSGDEVIGRASCRERVLLGV